MKKIIFMLLASAALVFNATAQIKVGDQPTVINPASVLELQSTNKGFLPTRLTTAQRDAISNPPTGLIVFNTTVNCLQINLSTPAIPIWQCLNIIAVGAIATINNCAGATQNGTLTNGVAAAGVSSVISYTGGNGGPHGGQVVTSTGVTGLTATLTAGSFASGAGTLTYTITGTPASSGTATFAINIGGQTCILTRTVVGFCATTTIVDVSAAGYTWMDRNLGATQAATSPTDAASYGDLFQWGRACEGHQVRTSALHSSGTASTAVPNGGNAWDGKFITNSTTPNDWVTPQNNALWQGVGGTNNPCPAGYRLPTGAELTALDASFSTQDAAGAFASPVKMPVAGNRFYSTGSLSNVGSSGSYWSSTVSGSNASSLYLFSSFSSIFSNFRANGFSVRCLKD